MKEKGLLYFNPDHQEHIDYVSDKTIQDILNKHKVEGEICFGNLEGNNAGQFWGYKFDGRGGMKKLSGKLVWESK